MGVGTIEKRIVKGQRGGKTMWARRTRVLVLGAVLTVGLLATVLLQSPCLLYTSPSPRDRQKSRMPSSA